MASKFSGSFLQLAAAAIAAFFAPQVAIALAVSAVVTAAAVVLFRPKESEGDQFERSPAYGFNQWRNPVKGDSPIPLVYSSTGHRVAPVYIQAWVTPEGEHEDDFSKVLRADGQAMSALLAVAEGPISGIEDIRVNDEPITESFTVKFSGNGTKTKFALGKTRVQVDTLAVSVAGTSKGWTLTDHTFTYYRDARRTLKFTLPDEFAPEYSPLVKVNGVEIDEASATGEKPHIWLETGNVLWVDHQTSYNSGALPTRFDITVKKRTMSGLRVRKKDGETELIFDTAPASGAEIVVTGQRTVFSGVRIEKRLGGTHQLPISGFESLRNTYGVGTVIGDAGSEVTFSTRDEVDDVVLLVTSSPSGFTEFDDEGNRSPTFARFKIEYRGADSDGNFTGAYKQLDDPAGERSKNTVGPGGKQQKKVEKNADVFEARGDSLSQLTWAYSIRGLLRRYVERYPNRAAGQSNLNAFTRNRYQVRVTRRGDTKGDNNTRFLDEITLSSYTEVIDERLNYPGTALLAVHAVASSRLQGGAPSITCKVKGTRDVYAHDGSSWAVSATAQSNPVWAACHVITNRRAGGGEHFTLASNIDATSAKAAADFCDASVTLDTGATETRARLDAVLDTRRSLLAVVTDLLRPAGIWPVLQGNTWKFVIDQAADLDSVPVVWDDTTATSVADSTLAVEHGPVSGEPTEVQVSFLDETADFDRKEVWVAPAEPASNRRIQRIEAYTITRRTEATRYANRVYTQASAGGLGLRMAISPAHIHFEAGDVVRVRSSRKGIDGYWRVMSLRFSTSDYFVQVEAMPYVRAVYGQQAAPQTTRVTVVSPQATRVAVAQTTRATASSGTTTTTRTRPRRMAARMRRVS